MAQLLESDASHPLLEDRDDISQSISQDTSMAAVQSESEEKTGRCTASFYNLMEPILVALSFSAALEISNLSNLCYVLVDALIMLPLLLTKQEWQIKVKKLVTWVKIGIALIAITLKTVATFEYETAPEEADLARFLGFYYKEDWKNFTIDCVVILLSVMILLVLASHAKDPQPLLQHKEFSRSTHFFFYTAVSLVLLDTCLTQNFVQLLTILSAGFISIAGIMGKHNMKRDRWILIAVQVLLAIQVLLQFAFRLPGGDYVGKGSPYTAMFGVEGFREFDELYQSWAERLPYERLHILSAGLSIFVIKTFIISYDVMEEKISQISRVTDVGRDSGRETKIGRIQDMKQYFKNGLMMNLVRIQAFIWAYMYHDWQAVPLLIFILHSSIYWNKPLFKKFMTFVYCPYTLIYLLWLFVVNIPGIVDYRPHHHADELTNPYKHLLYGFYQYKIPILEQAAIIIYVISFFGLLSMLEKDPTYQESQLQNKKKDQPQEVLKSLGDSTWWQELALLFLIYIEFPLMLCLVLFGLGQMDFYHIMLLFFFVAYMLNSRLFNKGILALVIFANFFILENYIFTLVVGIDWALDPKIWPRALGFGPSQYNPGTNEQYFRYIPPADQWIILILALAQYRRLTFLGKNEEESGKIKEKTIKNLKEKIPRCYSVVRSLNLIYFHSIVNISIFAFLLILSVMKHNVLNDISQLLILVMLSLYLSKGLEQMLLYWPLLTIYQAFVVIALVTYYFIMESALNETAIVGEIAEFIRHNLIAFEIIGLQFSLNQQNWVSFFPYVFLFSVTIILSSTFHQKIAVEKYKLKIDESIEDDEKRKKHITEQYEKMCYKFSYRMYAAKKLWFIMDAGSYLTWIVQTLCILCFSVYFQLAVIWLYFLLIFLIQTFYMSYRFSKLREEQERNHRQQVEEKEKRWMRIKSSEDIMYVIDKQTDEKLKAELKSQNNELLMSELEKLKKDDRKSMFDNEVIQEFDKYKKDAYIELLNVREKFWGYQFFMIIVGLTLVYLSPYLSIVTASHYEDAIQHLTFIFYFFGVNKGDQSYFQATMPLYILLAVMMIEKFAQKWQRKQMQPKKEEEKVFKEIEDALKKVNATVIEEKKSSTHAEVKVRGVEELLSQYEEGSKVNWVELCKIEGEDEAKVIADETELKREVEALMKIKYTLKKLEAVKIFAEALILLFAWCLVIYAQDFFSSLIFFALTYYTCKMVGSGKTRGALRVVWMLCMIVFVLVYTFTLSNMSSYNCESMTMKFPDNLLSFSHSKSHKGVYPSANIWFFYIPSSMQVYSYIDKNPTDPTVNVEVSNYAGFYWNMDQFPVRVWLIILMWISLILYYAVCSFWTLHEKVKIRQSKEFHQKIQKYRLYYALVNKEEKLMQVDQLYRKLYEECSSIQNVMSGRKFVFIYFQLVLIVFTLAISIFNATMISFAYFVFCMVLIQNYIWHQKNLYDLGGLKQSATENSQNQEQEGESTRKDSLKETLNVMIPYMLVDIFLILLTQWPQDFMINFRKQKWVKAIGINQAWVIKPLKLKLGYIGEVNAIANEALPSLVLKSLVFFLIYLQLRILTSNEYKKFMCKAQMQKEMVEEQVSKAYAYRFNNCKSALYVEKSHELTTMNQLLDEAKATIDEFAKIQDSIQISQPSRLQKINTMGDYFKNQLSVISAESPTYRTKTITLKLRKKDQEDLFLRRQKTFLHRKAKTGCCTRLYQFLRRTFVLEILFRKSYAHLLEMMQKAEAGETSIWEAELVASTLKQISEEDAKTKERIALEGKDITEERQKEILEEVMDEVYEQNTPKIGCSKQAQRYCSLVPQIWISQSEKICYLFMLVATIKNGGYLYLLYPAMVFGSALIQENRPRKIFWYTVIIYTQIIIIANFFVQLQIFELLLPTFQTNLTNFLITANLGISIITNPTFATMFYEFWPQIVIIAVVLIHIQVETEAGMFNVTCYDKEKFEVGWKRYLKAKCDHECEIPKLEPEKEIKEEIEEEKDISDEEKDISDEEEEDDAGPGDGDVETDKIGSEEGQESSGKLKDACRQKIQNLLYNNTYITKLFPIFKQQKPGYDYYAYILTVQMVLLVYIMAFYTSMNGQNTTIAEQFSSSQFSGKMVVAVLLMVLIMLVDRIIYANYSFEQETKEEQQSSENQISFENPNKYKVYNSSEIKNYTYNIDEKKLELESQKRRLTLGIAMRFYWMWVVLFFVHFWIFYIIPRSSYDCLYPKASVDTKACSFQNSGFTIFFYCIFIVYFILLALQIKEGLPENRRGSFAIQSDSKPNYYAFRVFMGMPFIFELRSIIDWTFTGTSLDVFQWIKLAQIQADMYIAKCYNKPYMEKPTGEKIPHVTKGALGCLLTFGVIMLIFGPLLLFSNINPISKMINTSNAALDFKMQIDMVQEKTIFDVELFSTTKTISSISLNDIDPTSSKNETYYDELKFGQQIGTITYFSAEQIRAFQMAESSDNIWLVTEPKRAYLRYILEEYKKQEYSSLIYKITGIFDYSLDRPSQDLKNPRASGSQSFIIDQQENVDQLIQMLNCSADNPVLSTVFSNITINPAIVSDDSDVVLPLNGFTQDYYMYGYNLTIDCTNQEQTFWTLNEIVKNNTGYIDKTEKELFQARGFGFFIFNGQKLPSVIAAYATSLIVFYSTIVYIAAGLFRSLMVPITADMFIQEAPKPDKILNVCHAIFIYRLQREYIQEEYYFFRLIDIFRSPTMIKELCGSSIKPFKKPEDKLDENEVSQDGSDHEDKHQQEEKVARQDEIIPEEVEEPIPTKDADNSDNDH